MSRKKLNWLWLAAFHQSDSFFLSMQVAVHQNKLRFGPSNRHGTSTNDQIHHIHKHSHAHSLCNSPTHRRTSEIIDFCHRVAVLSNVTRPQRVTSVLCMSLTCGGLRDWLCASGLWRSRGTPVHKFLFLITNTLHTSARPWGCSCTSMFMFTLQY